MGRSSLLRSPLHNLKLRQRAKALLVLLCILGSLCLASEPYLRAYATRPPGTYFWAVPTVNYYDAHQYLAFTQRVLEGQWLIGDPFTAEGVRPRLIMPHVYFQAALSRVFGLDVIASFQVCRVLFGLAMLAAAWWLGKLLIRSSRQRLLYILLVCFSAGAAWYVQRLGFSLDSIDRNQPEGNTLFTLGNLPHLSLSTALLTGLFATLVEYERDRRARWLAATVALSFLLSWIHPFDYLMLVLGLGAYALFRWVERGRFPTPSLHHGLALGLAALPAALYLVWVTRADPVYRQLANDILEKNKLTFYAIGYGPFILPALALFSRRELVSRYALPLCWVLCVLLFLLTPFRLGGKQPRMVGGLHIPLCLLAAVAVDWLPRLFRGRVRKRRHNPWLRGRQAAAWALSAGFLGFTVAGGLWVYGEHRRLLGWKLPMHFQPPEVRALYARMRPETAYTDVTLGGTFTGGWTPVLTRSRVYWGHWHMTLREPLKSAQRDWFFTTPGEEQAKAAWLRRQGVDWVIYWPWEWSDAGRWPAGPQDPAGVPGLEPVFQHPSIRLYRVRKPSPGGDVGA